MCQVEARGHSDPSSGAAGKVPGKRTSTLSYSQQFQSLKNAKDRQILESAYPKPSQSAQARAPGAYRLIGTPDQYAKHEERPLTQITSVKISPKIAPGINDKVCKLRLAIIVFMHALVLLMVPSSFSWWNLGVAVLWYTIPGIFGVTLGYHRLLAHRSFRCHRLFEYFCAFMGANAGQGDPMEWVSHHRYHHLHTDTPLDPHSPYEGFWWSHMGWLFKTELWMLDMANVQDMKAQKFYRYLRAYWVPYTVIIKPALIYAYGGMDLVIWAIAVPMVYGWHTTFLVNSAAHLWGRRPYATGDLSTNNWWVSALAFGEGWHNSHHAFPYSARHGLEWWEFDATWCLVRVLEMMGLVWDVRVPSEAAKARKRRLSTSGHEPGNQLEPLTAHHQAGDQLAAEDWLPAN